MNLQPDDKGWYDLPEPQLESRHTWIFNFPAGHWYHPADWTAKYSGSRGQYGFIVTQVRVEVNREPDGEAWTDCDAFGYLATKTGKRDKRSGLERVWVDHSFYEPFKHEVETWEAPS